MISGLIARLENKFRDNSLSFYVIEISEIPSLSKIRVTRGEDSFDMIFINLLHIVDLNHLISLLERKEYKVEAIPRQRRISRNIFQLVDEFKAIYGDRFSYADLIDRYKLDEKVPMKKKIWIRCKEHDMMFQQNPGNHLVGNGYACPICLENRIINQGLNDT